MYNMVSQLKEEKQLAYLSRFAVSSICLHDIPPWQPFQPLSTSIHTIVPPMHTQLHNQEGKL